MYTQEEKSSTGSVVFYLFGAALAVGVGMLLAPRPGRESRELISDWIKKRRESAKEIGSDVSESVRSSGKSSY